MEQMWERNKTASDGPVFSRRGLAVRRLREKEGRPQCDAHTANVENAFRHLNMPLFEECRNATSKDLWPTTLRLSKESHLSHVRGARACPDLLRHTYVRSFGKAHKFWELVSQFLAN